MKKFLSGILVLVLILSVFIVGAVMVSASESTGDTDNAAKIGETEYATLEEAIKAVPKNTPTTIYLLKDYTIGSVMVGHQYTQDITIDLGGHTLSNNSIVLTAYRNGTTLTVQNGTIKGNASTGSLRATYGGKIILGEGLTVAGAGGSAVLVYLDNGSVEIAAKNGVEFVGGKQDFKLSANDNNKLSVAASIGKTYFGTLADAFGAAKNGDTIELMSDLTIDSETYTVNDGISVTLDMNGKKITVTDNKTVNYELFYIYGAMTVTGEGTIELTATNNRAWNAMSAIFHNRGGILTIENGTFTHLGGTDMAYVVDNSGNWYGDATTNINGGTLTSSYIAIRNRMEQNTHGASGTAYLNVYGGKIEGTSRAIWAQAASTSVTSPASGVINISGGEVGLVQTPAGNGSQCLTTISGGTVAAFKGEAGELTVTGGTVGTTTLLAVDGNEAVAIVGNVGYSGLEEAISEADGETVTLLKNITLDNIVLTITNDVTIDFNGYTVTVEFYGPADEPERGNGEYVVKIESFMNITNGADVVLKDSSADKTGGLVANNEKWSLSSLITTAKDSSLVIESGNYKQENAVLGKGMIDTRGSDNVTIQGGNFHLGNVGTDSNGSPWIFNASGRNSGHINVLGGTYNADVFHQYYVFEVQVPDELQGTLALRYDDATKTYTVVDAVAYVVEKHGNYEMKVGYATLEEALAACDIKDGKVAYRTGTYYASKKSEGETIVLLKDVVLENGLVIATNKSIVLDLNGKTISQTKTCTASYEMIANNGSLTIKDSVGTGKIILTDNGSGDPNFGWGSYTIRNSGTLVVNGGTIEFVGTQAAGTHCSLAIFQYSGSTTINGGNIVNNNYRSVRLWSGDITINDGNFEGQVWVHCVNDSADLTIKGGSFAPAKYGHDASSVFVNNSGYSAKLSITGGYFATKVGANNVDALAGCITGGEFSESAKANTNPTLFDN